MPNLLFLRPGSRLPWPVIRPVGDRKHGQSISINRQVCVIGARSRVHLPLESTLISRTHAVIINDRDETYVRDLASTNRVYLNGSAVREARLNKADLLRIGPFTFFCHSGFPSTADLLDADAGGPTERSAVVVEGTSQRVAIHGRTLLIGSREGCDLRLDKSLVSRTHALIYSRDGKRVLRDLNSTDGTFVNDSRVREAELRAGDKIRIGVALLTFEHERIASDYVDRTQLRLAAGGEDEEASAILSGTGFSLDQILSASMSIGGDSVGNGSVGNASIGNATVGAGSMGNMTVADVLDLPSYLAANDLELAAPEIGFSSGILASPEPFAEALDRRLEPTVGRIDRPEPDSMPSPHGASFRVARAFPGTSTLGKLLGKFAPALASLDDDRAMTDKNPDVPPSSSSAASLARASHSRVVLPRIGSRSSMLGRNAPERPKATSPAELRCIEMATADELFAPAGESSSPSSSSSASYSAADSTNGQASMHDLLEDEFVRDFGL
jgi:pSer/pThr/pTyr-binding forkhead associated (FHA) protein